MAVDERDGLAAAEAAALRRRVRDLEEEASALRELIDNLDVGVFTMDDAGGKAIVARANPALARILGYPSVEAIIGQSAFEHYSDPKERFETQAQFMADPAFRASGVLRLEAVRLRRDTREPVPILLRLKATFDDSGKLAHFYGVMEDTRDRKRAEKAFQASEARFVSMFEASPVGMALTDLAGVVVRSNRALQTMLGWSDAELLGRSFDTLASDGRGLGPLPEAARRAREAGAMPLERPFACKDGSVAWGWITVALLHGDDGVPTQGVLMVQDVTRRKHMEQELLRVAKLDSLALLAGGIAHDFNNLLTPILGNVSIALARAHGPDREALRQAEQAAGRARELTRQLMTFARGGMTEKRAGFIADVLRECLELALHGTNVRGELDASGSEWASHFDQGQMVQAFSNLVINAAQAMPGGGVVRCDVTDVELDHELGPSLPAGRYVRVRVSDHGRGIPPEDLPRVFDPFFSTKQQGRGLGLATTHTIVTTHGGRIGVTSEVGTGTTFEVLLPASSPGEVPEAVRPARPVRSAGAVARVLVMDDERAIREVASAMLGACGYEVDAVADGNQAIDAYELAMRSGRPYSAVVLDLTVPAGRGGVDTMARLLEIDPGVRGIVSSGYSVGAVVEDPRRAGFRAAVHKPYTLDELRSALAEVIGQAAST
jgi:PAS domain S-box-containing protein